MSAVLTIRPAQFRAFEEDQLYRWIERFLRTAYPNEISNEEKLRSETVASVNEARRRGLMTGYEIRKYVHVAFLTRWTLEIGNEFQWARAILDDDERGGTGDRVSQLEQILLTPSGSFRPTP